MDDNLYAEILDSLPEGIYYLDRNRIITFWSRGAEKITGYTADQVIGKSCRNNPLNPLNEQGSVLCNDDCPLAATMQDGKPREANVYLHHVEGHRIPVQIRSIPIRVKGGSIVGIVETFNKGATSENLERRIRKLKQTALLDQLTAIGNRRHLNSRLKDSFLTFQESQRPFGLLFCDIDHFKNINDTFGHNLGDNVLRMVAQTLLANIDETDTVGRWGGEEFLVILRDIEAESLQKIGEKLLNLVRESHLVLSDKRILSATISIGGTLVRKNDTLDSVVGRADQLMYQSKSGGRNRITLG